MLWYPLTAICPELGIRSWTCNNSKLVAWPGIWPSNLERQMSKPSWLAVVPVGDTRSALPRTVRSIGQGDSPGVSARLTELRITR